MSDNTTSIDRNELNQSLSSPASASESTSLCCLSPSSSSRRVCGLQQSFLLHRHSSWCKIIPGHTATPFATDFALRFAAEADDVHELRWCSWLPRNSRHHVLILFHFSSIISQLYIWKVRQSCPLPSIAAFANGLSARTMPGSCLFGERFQWRRVLLSLFRYISCLAALNEVISF